MTLGDCPPGLAPGGIVFRHYAAGKTILERRISAVDAGRAPHYALEDAAAVRAQVGDDEPIGFRVFDGDTGEELFSGTVL